MTMRHLTTLNNNWIIFPISRTKFFINGACGINVEEKILSLQKRQYGKTLKKSNIVLGAFIYNVAITRHVKTLISLWIFGS